MNLLTEIDGHKFNIGTLRSRLANIISEARDSELRVVAMTADDLIVALLAERTQAKQQFSLAEEGLANYAQENERLKAALERIKALRYGLELHSDPEERAEYWSGMALEYRRIAAEALRPAVPQTCDESPK